MAGINWQGQIRLTLWTYPGQWWLGFFGGNGEGSGNVPVCNVTFSTQEAIKYNNACVSNVIIGTMHFVLFFEHFGKSDSKGNVVGKVYMQ